MYRALYRKWRPQDFDDVWGQDHVTGILKYEVASGKVSHAYLFCGSRGTGKTSSAKILAKAVNCLHPKDGNPCNECEACRSIDEGRATDVIEMDAASNTGVNDVRDIRDEIVFTPAALRYRVYIIDEVHMMSGGAFNALLKTLEEPPAHVIFILATTELHKLPSTIVSRCQRFDFHRISGAVLARRLLYISEHEGIDLTEDGARLLARLALGGMRDAISLLELCAGRKEKIDEKLVAATCGAGDTESVYAVIEAIRARDYAALYRKIHELVMSSRDVTVFWQDLIDCYRDMMVYRTAKNAVEYLDLTDAETERIRTLSEGFSMETMVYHVRLLEDALGRMQRTGLSRRATAELTLTRLCDPVLSGGEESLLLRISELEKKVAALTAGVVPLTPSAPSGTVAGTSPAGNTAEAPTSSAPEKDPTVKRSGTEEILGPEEKKPDPAAEKKPASADDPSSFRPYGGFREIAEDIVRSQGSLAGLLRGAHGYLSGDGRFLLRLASPFYVTLLNTEANRASLAASLAAAGTPVREILLEAENSSSSHTVIDELTEALEQK